VLRFWNNEVLTNTKGILEVIRDYLNHPPPTPPLKGGGIMAIPIGKPEDPYFNRGNKNHG